MNLASEEEAPFIIRTYKKKELACLYNPDITPRCAIRMLNKWIKLNRELYQKLVTTGYHARTRTFTPLQVRLIVNFLDIP